MAQGDVVNVLKNGSCLTNKEITALTDTDSQRITQNLSALRKFGEVGMYKTLENGKMVFRYYLSEDYYG